MKVQLGVKAVLLPQTVGALCTRAHKKMPGAPTLPLVHACLHAPAHSTASSHVLLIFLCLLASTHIMYCILTYPLRSIAHCCLKSTHTQGYVAIHSRCQGSVALLWSLIDCCPLWGPLGLVLWGLSDHSPLPGPLGLKSMSLIDLSPL